MPTLDRIIETALYVDDLDRARTFYRDVLQLEAVLDSEVLCAYDVGGHNVLLLFARGASTETKVLPSGRGLPTGEIPPHDGSGPQHICFAVSEDQLTVWEAHLSAHGIPIEGRTQWVRGGRSIYFRDPDAHLLELMTPGNWPTY
ncbi:VOC family protein [Nocardia pseudobrasiliensis]|uniref:Catechol 2,3-dioxygenase-like lactoylglutathione lyase family enzyme n=1 Tax=Nocardia pseudobrasiliensis TaxID=45979 RepID=A0A370ICA4_9NOCA|nr:VOC family protein [Nocardia pseudobrasiliensis]RDI68346.1 catechol 2,3-dioxygenase-like lactoylglutathione lyase family enzyme [Nocardia pseudobrasiliensis]